MPVLDHMPDGTLVKEIAALVQPTPIMKEAPRGEYVILAGDKISHFGVPLLAEPKTIRVASLAAIVDACQKANLFDAPENLVVHVVSPIEVRLINPSVGDERQQFIYMQAVTETQQPVYRQFTPLDEFIISVLVSTTPTDERARMLDYVGSLTAGLATEINDDGAAQSTVAKRGITRTGTPTKWENPVNLAPFRTFAEIEQPESAFVLRLRQNKNGEDLTAQAALFEADGGAWKLEAISKIGEWLRALLPESVTVLA